LSHFSMINNGYHVGTRQEFDKRISRVCVNNPLFHVYGCIVATLNSLYHGATMIFPAPHFSPEDSLKAILSEKCNVLYGTPTMFVDLVAKQRELKLNLREIDLANTGGSCCSPQLVKDITRELKVRKMQSIYGLTETSAVVFESLPNDKNELVEEFVGTISDNIEAKVVDKEGNLVPFGEPGELCIRGYCNMMGYYGDEEKTKEVFGADGW
jgi:medium-chain acyl-CoA ligase, mitochondrial